MIHTKACDEDPYAGIIILVSKKFTILEETELIQGRLVNIKIKHTTTEKEYSITTIYGYTATESSQKKMRSITEKLETVHTTTQHNVIFGDLNFVENDLDRTSEGKLGKRPPPVCIDFWTAFLIFYSF